MKKIIFMMASLLMFVGCTTKKPAEATIGNVPFKVAKNYFFKNDQTIPVSPKITTAEAFEQLFGMAAFMGKDGQPTAIDFDKQFVLAIVLPVTDVATEIIPLKVEANGNQLFYSYEVKTGKLCGDKGYISQSLFENLFMGGIQLITKLKKNMKNMLMSQADKVILRHRALIESVNDELKNMAQVEHSRHRSIANFLCNTFAALAAYSYFPKKPSLNLEFEQSNQLCLF